MKFISRVVKPNYDINPKHKITVSKRSQFNWDEQVSNTYTFEKSILLTRRHLLDNGSNNDNINIKLNPLLLELAKLNFNMVQDQHKMELMHISRWWLNTGIARKLDFARDRLVECFLSNIGICWEPRYERCREWLTKIISFALVITKLVKKKDGRERRERKERSSLVRVIDDIYDVYGSLEELELFTDAIERWDCKATVKLPQYMKICFLALYNTVNEMAFEIRSEQQFDILPHLTKSSTCSSDPDAMLMEAKWCHKGYMPTFVEYQHNGSVSSFGYVFLLAAYFTTNQNINDGVLYAFENNHSLLFMFAEIKRGEVVSSIYCYMQEKNVSEMDAREHVKDLFMETWKEMNLFLFDSSPFDRSFVNLVLNFARTSLFMYQYGDGLGAEHSKSVEHVLSLIVNPIHIEDPSLKTHLKSSV
ncbi:hypothetical protein MKX03_025966 [Papaver bracteatum]|nr:hypothetical protein MKX03_025966 [Papaver bracteatum]